MAQHAISGVGAEFRENLRAGSWDAACALYERGMPRDERLDPANRLYYAIALIRNGRINSGIAMVDDEVAAEPDANLMMRRYVLPALIDEKRFDPALLILDRLLVADPAAIELRRLRASLLGRLRRFDDGMAEVRALLALAPDDVAGHGSLLQLMLQAGDAQSAADHARSLGAMPADHPRLAALALLAFRRAGLAGDGAALAGACEAAGMTDPDVVAAMIQAHNSNGDPARGVAIGHAMIDAGRDGAALRLALGQAYLATRVTRRFDHAVDHLTMADQFEPDDGLTLALLGEALLRSGRYSEALDPLSRAVSAAPRHPTNRALYARALKQCGQNAEAAREFRQLIKMQPESHRWHRYAAGALAQAGFGNEAADLFDAFVARRGDALGGDFIEGLAALWDRVDEVRIPQARLDWAWSLRADRDVDRTEWERAAKWGNLADHFILDWLECRDDRIGDAMQALSDLSDAERAFAAVDQSRGMVLVSAHIGPMYAGPLALELLGIRAKWLASTPSVARTSYARSLISTSDQTGNEVAKKVLDSLRAGDAVVIANDGAINLAAPRVAFEGQEITYSSFAARMAHRLNIPSLFVAPKWNKGRIEFVIEPLPDALPDEGADDHADRWQVAYLAALRRYLSGSPENLRLGGGIWRHIGGQRNGDE